MTFHHFLFDSVGQKSFRVCVYPCPDYFLHSMVKTKWEKNDQLVFHHVTHTVRTVHIVSCLKQALSPTSYITSNGIIRFITYPVTDYTGIQLFWIATSYVNEYTNKTFSGHEVLHPCIYDHLLHYTPTLPFKLLILVSVYISPTHSLNSSPYPYNEQVNL